MSGMEFLGEWEASCADSRSSEISNWPCVHGRFFFIIAAEYADWNCSGREIDQWTFTENSVSHDVSLTYQQPPTCQ